MSRHPRRLGGLPLFLVAVLAIVVALGGAATAGALITGKDIKDGSVTGKDIKDGSLTLKDLKKSEAAKLRGATGATGATGAAGATGAKGDPGASVFAPPPSGTVVKGGSILNSDVSGVAVGLRQYVPLPFTLAQPLVDTGTTDRTLWFGGSSSAVGATETSTTACPGTAANPVALPGKLCVYQADASNIQSNSVVLYGGVTSSTDAAGSNGFYFTAGSAAAGTVTYRVVWVYTAP
jgi:hypothetical protein